MGKKLKITEDQLKRLIVLKEEDKSVEEVEIDATEEEKDDMSAPTFEEEDNNKIFESIRNNFKRFL